MRINLCIICVFQYNTNYHDSIYLPLIYGIIYYIIKFNNIIIDKNMMELLINGVKKF